MNQEAVSIFKRSISEYVVRNGKLTNDAKKTLRKREIRRLIKRTYIKHIPDIFKNYSEDDGPNIKLPTNLPIHVKNGEIVNAKTCNIS